MRVTRAADVVPVERRWLVEPYVPAHEITVLTGARRAGKGMFLTLLAAHASRGVRPSWDIAPRDPLQRHNVIWATAGAGEDGQPELVARFRAAGGDESRLLLAELEDPMAGLDALEELLRKAGPWLLVADPLQALIGSLDSPKARQRMETLVGVSRTHRATVVAIQHPTADGARGRGRGEILDVARSQLLLGPHPNDSGLVVMAQGPSSYGMGESQAFRLAQTEDGSAALVHVPAGEWDVDGVSYTDLLPRPPQRPRARRRSSPSNKAEVLLKEVLSGTELPREAILRMARSRQISASTVERAATRLGVRRRSTRLPDGSFGPTLWSLAGDREEPPSEASEDGGEDDASDPADWWKA